MKISKEKVAYVISRNPEAKGDNTKFLIEFYEATCESRGIPKTWENIRSLMIGDYPPESLTRARRKHVSSTNNQKTLEINYYNHYANN